MVYKIFMVFFYCINIIDIIYEHSEGLVKPVL